MCVDPLPSFPDDCNNWSLVSKLVRGHTLTDFRGFEESNSSCRFSFTIGGIELLSISSRLGIKIKMGVQVYMYMYIYNMLQIVHLNEHTVHVHVI